MLDIGLVFLNVTGPGLIETFSISDDQFDEYTRRQYLTKKPAVNPFGDGEKPGNFADLHVLTKV